jgi:putative transposase
VVWITKYRKKIWNAYEQERVATILKAIAVQYDMRIGEIRCMSDHVHMTVSAPSRIAPFQIAQILKSISTNLLLKEFPWLKKHYWGGQIWAAGYFVRTVGPGLTKEQIDQYVLEQSEEID